MLNQGRVASTSGAALILKIHFTGPPGEKSGLVAYTFSEICFEMEIKSRAKDVKSDPAHAGVDDSGLETAIGRQVREFRTQLNMTVAELVKQAGMFQGMWSKIENGLASPSLATLNSIVRAFNVPVSFLFSCILYSSSIGHMPHSIF